MKNFLKLSFILTLVFTASISLFAHTLVTSNSIGAVMHIDPNDNPVAGDQATFYFDLKDTTDPSFSLQSCNSCKITISKNSEIIDVIKRTPENSGIVISNNTTVKADYVFKESGVYTITLENINELENTKPFVFHFDVAVQDGDGSVSNVPSSVQTATSYIKTHLIHIIVFGVALIIAVFIIFTDDSKKVKKENL